MNGLVSIIIPCYNMEKYIMRCLKSVEAQTIGMEHLEIILVNDGSDDNTLAYLKTFEDRHIDQVYIVDFTSNRGLSVARNVGMEVARGDYFFFLDADDAIDETAIEKMYNIAEEYQCDLVECGYRPVFGEGKWASMRNGDDWYRNLTNTSDRQWYIVHMPKLSMCARLWRKDFLINNNLWLDENCYMSEDVLFTGQAMFLIKDCYYINEQLYFYYYNQESMSHSSQYNAVQNRGVVEACIRLKEKLKERGLWDMAMSEYREELEWYFIGPSFFYTMNNIYQEIGYLKNFVKNMFPDICENKYLQVLDETHAEYMRHLR